MSVFRGAWRSYLPFGREGGSAPRAGLAQTAARALGAVLMAGAIWGLYGPVSKFFSRGPLAAPVKRADLIVSISGQGVVESGDCLDLKCRVRGWRNILEIVPEGSFVRQGDVLVRLGSASLENALKAERTALARAEAAVASAKKELSAAELAIGEYREGTYVRERLQSSRSVLMARQKLANTERALVQRQILLREGFGSLFQVKALELAVEKAQSELAMANTRKEVLEDFTRDKMLAELTAQRDAAAARMRSEHVVVETQTAKISRLQEDLDHCLIRAPRDGMAIYAHARARGDDGTLQPSNPIYPGASVRQFQTLVRVANLGRMQVRLLVPEDQRGQLRRGQRAHLDVLDRELHGEVTSIADWPEPAEMPTNALKRYAVLIAINDGAGEPLKPGLTAEVEILVKHKLDALVIPEICIVEDAGQSRVFVKKRGAAEPRAVLLGIANDAVIEVIDGLKEDELVLMNPPRHD